MVVACDHLGVGTSDSPADPSALTVERIAAANHATVEHVWSRLADGTLTRDFPALPAATRLGIGQSMGGCFTIAAQGRHATFDAIGVRVTLLDPGVVAAEAASARVPVLVAVGDRDVVPDPHEEPHAYPASPDVTLYVCERMAHMQNFAGTRARLWQRVHAWGDTVAAAT